MPDASVGLCYAQLMVICYDHAHAQTLGVGHLPVGRYAAAKGLDVVITVGSLAKNISDNAEGVESYHFDTVENAIDEIDTVLHKDDIVLVKASHSMHFEKIVEFLKEL